MSEEQIDRSADVSTDGVSENSQDTSSVDRKEKDLVSYETYKRTLNEAKKAKSRLQEMESRLTGLEQEKLQHEGKKDELIDTLRKQLGEKDKQLKTTLGNFALTSVKAQLSQEAMKLGCVDTDALSALMDLNSLEVDGDTFQANQEQLKMMLEETRKKRPYLFNKSGLKIDSTVPKGVEEQKAETNLKKMKTEDLKKKLGSFL